MRVAEVVGRTLAAYGVRHVFGVVGSGNFHVTNALVACGARFVPAAHEGGAATMADAYARVSGRLGVLSVHQGPGVTNALTGVTEAAKSRTPLVVLAPEATAPRSNFFIDLASAAAALGADHSRVRAEHASDDVLSACRLADSGRTVLLGLPLDVQAADAEPPGPLTPAAGAPMAAPGSETRALARALRSAHRPVFIAGRGATRPSARAELTRLADRWRTPGLAKRIAAEGRWRDVSYVDDGGPGRIGPRTLTIALDDALPVERTVAVDSGNFMGYPSMFLSVPDHHGFCFTQAFQSIGLGLAGALGAAVARPDRLTVAALGDGGYLMSAAELTTAVRLGLPLIVVVYGDGACGAAGHHVGPAG